MLSAVFDLVYLTHLVYRVEDDLIDAGRFEPRAFLKSRFAREQIASLQLTLVGSDAFPRVVDSQRRAAALYTRAVRREVDHREDTDRPFTPADLLTLGDRAAPLVSIVAVMCELANRFDSAGDLVGGILRLCTALQLVDDLQDIGTDLRDSNPTWPAKSLASAYPGIEEWPAGMTYSALSATGLLKNALELAEREADGAASALADLDADVIAAWALAWARNVATIPR
ncbi:squalene/phytoene synthase family protein [Agromyces sp. M3QZ16-3]|uniref:squalene/phytoene synthase family protein n=1 Tax=Agromyces sp. M3QZ16-3 TaxID=3447585 RepID=UPI003F6915CC